MAGVKIESDERIINSFPAGRAKRRVEGLEMTGSTGKETGPGKESTYQSRSV